MKYLKFLGLIVASIMLVSCGSSGGGGGADVSSGTSTITIAIGGSGQASIVEQKDDTMFATLMEFVDILSPAEAVAGTTSLCEVPLIPRDVSSIAISITGGGITPPITDNIIFSSFNDHCETVIRTYTVPNGTGRIFHADAMNAAGDNIYEGTTVKDINGADYVQIFMGQACNLFVDVKTGSNYSQVTEDINYCTDRANPCESITHPLTHPDIDASNKVICVASGMYDEEYGNEDFPILLKNGTELRCEGENHTSVIAQFDSYSWDNPTIGVVDGAISASINGCRVVVDDGETGISDSGADLTVDNCLIIGGYMDDDPRPTFGSVGIELSGDSTVRDSEIWYNEIGIDVIGGDPTINDNHLSCNGLGEGGIDLKINNRSEFALNAENNAWDNIPIYMGGTGTGELCLEDGTDICIFEGVEPDTSGARLADDGCPRFIPDPECYTEFDCPDEGMTCTDGICEQPLEPSVYNVSFLVSGLAASGTLDVLLYDDTDDPDPVAPLETVTATDNIPYIFNNQILNGHTITLNIRNMPPTQTCTFQASGSTSLTDSIQASDMNYPVVCQDIPVEPDGCDYYVADIGSDDNLPCDTPDAPCRTILNVADYINVRVDEINRTICVDQGLYSWDNGDLFPITFERSGTTLLCRGADFSSILDGTQGSSPRPIESLIFAGADNITIRGCAIRNFSGTAIVDNSNNMIIDANLIENGGCVGIAMTGSSTVTGNTIRNIQGNSPLCGEGFPGIGIDFSAIEAHATITDNTINGNDIGIKASGRFLTDGIPRATMTANGNDIFCNDDFGFRGSWNVTGMDITNNAWQNGVAGTAVGPLVHFSEGCSPGNSIDICYDNSNEPPVYDPWNDANLSDCQSECPAPSIVMHPNVTSQLGGALNVDINGTLYDATFYNQWSLVSPKQSYIWALDASLALYNLFHTVVAFDYYDDNPAMVWGCDRSPCMMVTPILAVTGTVRGYAFDNADRYGTDRAQVDTGYRYEDQSQTISFVQWSESECQ